MIRLSLLSSPLLPLLLLGACGGSDTTPTEVTVGRPAELRLLSGDQQRGIAGQLLPQPMVVQAVDSSGHPVPDQPLAFTPDLGGGTVSPDTVNTNPSGIAEVSWTLGPEPDQPQRLLVEVVSQDLGPFVYTWFNATARAAPTGLHFRVVEGGGTQSCGLTPEGKAYCWGTRTDGHMPLAPEAVSQDLTFSSIAAGFAHVCALTAAGAAYCWGQNERGQLGNGGRGTVVTPTAVSGGLVFQQIAAGMIHTCALTLAGKAYCWGGNRFAPVGGALGDGTTRDRLTPTEVRGGHRFSVLAAGGLFTCALAQDGRAYCWGARIGTRTGASDLTPVPVRGSPPFAALTAGANDACGLVADGKAYCWGENSAGQLGDGTEQESITPVAVSGGLVFSAIAAGGYHTCGLTTDGALACWGWDDQAFDSRTFNGGISIHSTLPVIVPGAPNLVQLSDGLMHGCGVTAEQLAYCWFDNGMGQLGSGDRVGSYQPVLVR
jgi:alpha-tubulin suppressor-like RCC1 family protein